MMPFHPIFAFSFSALIGLLGCIAGAFFMAVMLLLMMTPIETFIGEWIFNVVFRWCIKNRLRRPAIFLAHRRPYLPQFFDEVSSLDEMAFLCEAISHTDAGEGLFSTKSKVKDRLYLCIHTRHPLYVKYLVEVLMAYGWDINSAFDVIYKRDAIQELVNEGLFSQWKKPDPAIWQEWKPQTDSSYSVDKEYQCIGTLAALLKANRRFDTLYLLLTSFPQFAKSCAPLFHIAASDLPDFLLTSAYKAYQLTD